ncbi:hypothetical protein OESDEN_22490 [Oesophagostomum dentatum]|uniref:Uncharacterized protein n=1 Tax=Oesophagostomum dentatum TaxID=61180 RepID=A0A0B1S3T2_OESDE|nr:hypothetical protein OESDEN_22490 [Oesophagostomum dentatum]
MYHRWKSLQHTSLLRKSKLRKFLITLTMPGSALMKKNISSSALEVMVLQKSYDKADLGFYQWKLLIGSFSKN